MGTLRYNFCPLSNRAIKRALINLKDGIKYHHSLDRKLDYLFYKFLFQASNNKLKVQKPNAEANWTKTEITDTYFSKKMFVFYKLKFIFDILIVDLTNRIFFMCRFGPFLEFQTLALPTLTFETQAHGSARAWPAQSLRETLGG